MKTLICIAFLAIIGIVIASSDQYTAKYDGVDVDEILKNDRLLRNYFNCLMEKGICSPDGEELKRILPDALATECSKCSEQQKAGSKKVIHYLIDNKHDWWNELEAKYDKNGTYKKKYQDQIQKEGLKV